MEIPVCERGLAGLLPSLEFVLCEAHHTKYYTLLLKIEASHVPVTSYTRWKWPSGLITIILMMFIASAKTELTKHRAQYCCLVFLPLVTPLLTQPSRTPLNEASPPNHTRPANHSSPLTANYPTNLAPHADITNATSLAFAHREPTLVNSTPRLTLSQPKPPPYI